MGGRAEPMVLSNREMSKDYSQEIAEAFIHEEVSNFTTTYYNENLPSVHDPPARYNEDENESTLSLFQGPRGRASGATTKTLSNEEWCKIMLYVLTNLDEVKMYLG
jgi:hypothetical protein